MKRAENRCRGGSRLRGTRRRAKEQRVTGVTGRFECPLTHREAEGEDGCSHTTEPASRATIRHCKQLIVRALCTLAPAALPQRLNSLGILGVPFSVPFWCCS